MKDNNIIINKSFEFSVRIVNLYKYLKFKKQETIISSQLLKAGTSIGANITEANQAQSKKDFISKMGIANKEAHETSYWIRLLHKTDYIDDSGYNSIHSDCLEIIRILASIIKSSKDNL